MRCGVLLARCVGFNERLLPCRRGGLRSSLQLGVCLGGREHRGVPVISFPSSKLWGVSSSLSPPAALRYRLGLIGCLMGVLSMLLDFCWFFFFFFFSVFL